jgi:8-oxo-dGTP pyrophosphatase MutT (NUDIX family)
MFIYGDYLQRGVPNIQLLKSLFSGMTVDEKLLILSFDFSRIWYKIWLGNIYVDIYNTAKSRFDELISSSRDMIIKLINESDSIPLHWELPKGRKDSRESDIECATREFMEETGLQRNVFKIRVTDSIRTVTRDRGSSYIMKYWAALMTPDDIHIVPKITVSLETSSCHEHDEIKFVKVSNIDELVPSYLRGPILTLRERVRPPKKKKTCIT